MTREYIITVGDEYDFVKLDNSIKACREWAKRAFPKQRVTVQRPYAFCSDCRCAPCCCMVCADR